jgi:hypothetical protein
LVFTGNRVSFLNNIGTNLDRVRWAFVQGNSWTRDASQQSDPGVVHTLTLNFAERIALIGNNFTTTNGPVDQTKNDSETILSEGGGGVRTEGLGFASDSTATTLRDATATLNPNVLVNGVLPANYGIAIVAGKGAGQARRVTAYSAGTFTVDKAWDVQPDGTSRYATAVWGLQMAVIKGNTMAQAPRGIWLYGTAVRDVDIVDNAMTENGGILLRLYQNAATCTFQPALNLRIEANNIRNTQRLYGSYLSANFANMDGKAVGTATYGLEVRRNTLVANAINMAPVDIPEVAVEGYVNNMQVYTGSYDPTFAALLGTVFQGNSCTNCPFAFRLSTGAVGTVIDTSVLANSPLLWFNEQARGTGSVKALFTKVQ